MARKPSRRKSIRGRRKQSKYVDGAQLLQQKPVHFNIGPLTRIVRNTVPGILAKAAADTGYGLEFKFSSTISYLELVNLYDSYRIDKVEYIVELATPNLTNIVYPRVIMAPDWNNASVPASEQEVLEYRGARVFQFDPTHTVACYSMVPRVSNQVYNTIASSGYTTTGPEWCDTAYPNIPHFGMRLFVSDYNTTVSTVPVLRAYSRYYLSLRSTK